MSFIPSFFTIQAFPSRPHLTSTTSGKLQWAGGLSSPGAKFAAEPSRSFGRSAVHIRSCFNNKYWVAHNDGQRLVISATADKPVDDINDPGCTLFGATRRLHQQGPRLTFSFGVLGHTGASLTEDSDSGLAVTTRVHHTAAQQFHVVDWQTLLFLPSQVSFKFEGDFLVSRVLDRHFNYHRFESDMHLANIRVAHELFLTHDGFYRIRNMYFNRFSRNGNVWIWADTDGNDNSLLAMFLFVNLGEGEIALRNLGNNRFCGPDTREGKVDCLRAEFPTLTRKARLNVRERVLERTITDIRYRLAESRIHQAESVEVTHAFATNNTTSDNQMTVSFSIEVSRTTSWTNSISLTLGVTTTLTVTVVPVILTGTIEMSTELNTTREWGEVETTTLTRELNYQVTVPPRTRVRVTLMSMRAACDVPYSYTQRDLLPDGRRVSVVKHDGMFHGVNSYNFDVESAEVTPDALGRMYL